MVKRYASMVYRSSFIRNATVLATGSFFAQAIPLLILPVLTRMFTPALFGIQALLQTGGSFITPIATGQYELAIATPRTARRAQAIATVGLLLTVAVTLVLLGMIALFRDRLLDWFDIDALGFWIYAYPLLVLTLSLINIANYWLLRQGKFLLQTINKMVMAFSTAIIALIMGLLHVPYGLLIGFMGGVSLGACWAMIQATDHRLRLVPHESADYYKRVAKQYVQFPLFGGLPTAFNNFAAQIPLLIITAHYTLDVTGHYAVARNILYGGVHLIALCVGQVLLKHMAERVQNRQPIWGDYCKILAGLIAFGLCMMLGVYIVGPWFFGLYLGSGWSESAEITRILSFNVLAWFVAGTVAQAAIAIQKMKVVALWQVMYGAMACGLILFADRPFHEFMWCIVVLEVTSYTLYLLMVTAVIWRFDHDKRLAKETREMLR